MTQKGIINKSLGNTLWNEYTDTALWRGMNDVSGQGHRQAEAMTSMCVVASVRDKAEAIELCRIFVRDVFAIPSCCFYNQEKGLLSMYCGDAGSGWYNTIKNAESLCHRFSLKFFTV